MGWAACRRGYVWSRLLVERKSDREMWIHKLNDKNKDEKNSVDGVGELGESGLIRLESVELAEEVL